MGLSSAGLGSGLDIPGIVSALTEASFVPRQVTLDQREAEIQTELSAIGSLKSAFSSFQESIEKLKTTDTLTPRKIDQNKTDYLSAEVDPDAVDGIYNIIVEQVAEHHKLGANAVADADTTAVGEGQLTIAVGTAPEDSMTLDIAAGSTLNDIATLINDSQDNPGVTAAVVITDAGARLVMTSDESGEDNQLTVSATDTVGTGLSDTFGVMEELHQAKNAKLKIDGMDVTSQSNTITTALQGVTLNLTDADINETTRITVSTNDNSIKSTIKSFASSYNELMDTIDNLSKGDAASGVSAPLQSDSLPRSIDSQLRSLLGSSYSTGTDTTAALSEFGISFDRYGRLEVDDTKLGDVIDTNLSGLTEMFSKEDEGLAYKLYDLADQYLQTGGLFSNRDDSLNGQIDRIEDQRETLNRQMASYEARLTKQFTAMDLLVYEINSTSSMLESRFDSLPGLVRDKN